MTSERPPLLSVALSLSTATSTLEAAATLLDLAEAVEERKRSAVTSGATLAMAAALNQGAAAKLADYRANVLASDVRFERDSPDIKRLELVDITVIGGDSGGGIYVRTGLEAAAEALSSPW